MGSQTVQGGIATSNKITESWLDSDNEHVRVCASVCAA